MENSFVALQHEVDSSKELRTCIETLIKIFRNTVHNPEQTKYRSLRTANKNFNESIWRFDAGQELMQDCGWILQGDNIVLPAEEDLTAPLHFLIENRDVKPSEKEWVSETKHIIPNADKERERQLRQEAFTKKEKEMAELKKDMEERDALKASILAEHRRDKEKRKLPVGGSSRDYDRPVPATTTRGDITQPRRSTTNFLGGSGRPNTSSINAAESASLGQASALRHSTAISHSSHYQQQTARSTYPPQPVAYSIGRNSTVRTSHGQRNPDEEDDEGPLRLNSNRRASYGARSNYRGDIYNRDNQEDD